MAQSVHGISKTSVFLKTVSEFENLSEENQNNDTLNQNATIDNSLKVNGNIDHTELSKKDIEIEFKNVSFKYPDTENYILKDTSFKMEAGRTYALVGENGAGKTTITKLLLGLYKDYSGEISINGYDIRNVSNFDKLFSVAFQDFAKYEISLRENVVFDKNDRDKDILRSMDQLSFEISKFEQGLNTDIGYLTKNNITYR